MGGLRSAVRNGGQRRRLKDGKLMSRSNRINAAKTMKKGTAREAEANKKHLEVAAVGSVELHSGPDRCFIIHH